MPLESVSLALLSGLSYRQKSPTLQSLHPVQLGEELVHHAVCYTCAVVAPSWSQRIKLIEEKNAWLGSLRPGEKRGKYVNHC